MREPLSPTQDEDATAFAERVRRHFERKAAHNKRESLWSFLLVISATLAAAAFVAFGQELWLGKIIPFCLSLLATGTSAWLQFRKPHQLWSIYRTAQRRIEIQIAKHRFGIDEYFKLAKEQQDALLAKSITEVMEVSHTIWVPLIPSPETLEALTLDKGLVKATQDKTL